MLLVAIILLATVVRVAAAFVLKQPLISDSLAYFTMAQGLAERGELLDIYGQHIFYSAGYPLVLSPFFALFGSSVPVALAVNLLLGIASIILIYRITLALSGHRRAGLLAALFYTLWLPGIWNASMLAKENLSTPLLIGLALCTIRVARGQRLIGVALLAGVLWGASLITGGSTLLLCGGVAVALLILWRVRGLFRLALAGGMAFAVGTALILSPWLYATNQMVGRPILTTNAAFNLYLGNNPAATGKFINITSTPLGKGWEETRRRLGEVGNADRLQNEALRWIKENPGRAGELAARKLAYFWQPNIITTDDFAASKVVASIRLLEVVQYGLILIFGVLAFRSRFITGDGQWIVAVMIAGFWLIHGAIYIIPRYRDPVIPLLITMAAIPIMAWFRPPVARKAGPIQPERPIMTNTAVPLFVDVDGTLVRADISLESFVRIARSSITAMLTVLAWLIAGRAVAKTMAARRKRIDVTRLPYRQAVLNLIADAKADGRPVILASASHWRHIRNIARHLGLSAPVIATRGRNNLKGRAKLAAIRAWIGPDAPFDYVGNSRADRCLWNEARQGWSVGDVPPRSSVKRLGSPHPGLVRALIRAMRPHQWAKNALVLVPAFTSGEFTQPAILFTAAAAALLMSLVASSVYLLNDLLDIDADRAHHTKWQRPLACGDLSIPAALVAAFTLVGVGLAGGWLLDGPALTFWLFVYMAITLAYSLQLKSVMVGDVVALASLYTIRIWIGAVVIGVVLSFWLLLFSVFLFLSLAYLKRYIEMLGAIEPDRLLNGRGYVGGDLNVVMMSGLSAGMVAILVLALFAHDPQTASHYAIPELLWLLCLPLIYWMNRIWMMARRGHVTDDPVAFAIKDRRSILVGTIMACIFVAALFDLEKEAIRHWSELKARFLPAW